MNLENRAFTLGELEIIGKANDAPTGDEKLLQAEMWKRERQALLEMTGLMDEHPEGYEGPCLCQLCCSYEAD